MILNNDLTKIKKIIEEFFQKTNFEVNLESLKSEDGTVFVKIRSEEPKVLIGQSGQTLSEIQHLLRALLRRQIENPFYFELDVNNYKEKKIEYLREFARSLADEVSISKREKTLEPMPAYERRIIHLELAERKDVRTQSVGEEPHRKLVISPFS